ncbi:MAG: HEPN domain-containing protein [Candidatus Thorarchaeota archaeon]|nr:HEPN domain-containing protein [Candidatus Thorarchaeota archaeon]
MSVGMDENEAMKQNLKELVHDIFNVLSEYVNSGAPLPTKQTIELSMKELGSGARMSTGSKIDLNLLSSIESERIQSLSHWSNCIMAIETNSTIAPVLGSWISIQSTSIRLSSKYILHNFLSGLYAIHDTFKLDQSKFDSAFLNMMASFESKTTLIQVIVPLENLILDSEKYELIDGWSIERISDETLSTLVHTYPDFGGMSPRFSLLDLRYGLTRVAELEKTISPTEEKPEMDFVFYAKCDYILDALRVLKSGLFVNRGILTRHKDWLFDWGFSISGFGPSSNTSLSSENRYKLSSDEIPALKEIASQMIEDAKPSNLSVALRRFKFGQERIEYEDKLIDFMIALESLLLHETNELSYRLSLRTAVFIGSDSQERDAIFKQVKLAYEIRSKIVHGVERVKISKELNKSSENIRSLTRKVEEILRRSIRKMLTLHADGVDISELPRIVDAQICRTSVFSSEDDTVN